MNDGFPPLQLAAPETHKRRSGKGQFVPLPPEVLARREEIAQVLHVKVSELSTRLKSLSPDQRKAIFYKLEHDAPAALANLSGTDLKAIAQPTPDVIYAIPRTDSLDKLTSKIEVFRTDPIVNQHVRNDWLAHLKSISEADPLDRLSADLRERYASLIKQNHVICEIEFLTFVAGKNKQRKELEDWISELQKLFAGGVHGNYFEHELMPPTCRAVIRCSGATFKALVEEPRWIERIRWIESKPKFQTFSEVLQAFRMQDLHPIDSPTADAPVVCIIDSGVNSGNPFLAKVVRDDLSKSFLSKEPDDASDGNGHGSAIASLASYHMLNLAEGAHNQPKVWIANARILNEDNQIEDERLFSRVLDEVVTFYAARGVRIFCLAVGDDRKIWGDTSRKILPRKSWVARRIDQLSRKHDVIFVTCTGNIDLQDVTDFTKKGTTYPNYLSDETCQLLDPGQAALAVTVGSIAPGTTIIASRDSKAVALRNQPSPFTRSGPGIRREIKPEVVEYGGNLALDSMSGGIRENRGLQLPTASRQLTPAVSFWTGTSFAAPKVAHRLALIDQDLRSLGLRPSAPLLRAFLVNSASHRNEDGELATIRSAFPATDSDRINLLLGYGLPDHICATGSDDYSVITYFQGEIKPDHVMFFDVPVPIELAERTDRRRLTVTVVYAPDVQRWGLERYFGVDLKWRMFRGDKSRDEIIDAMSESADEADEPSIDELFEEEVAEEITLPSELKFRPGIIKRSRGTVQHATYEWTQHREEYSEGHYTLAIAALKRWGGNDVPIAVVVRLEDLGRAVPIFARVRTSVEVET